MQFLLLLCIFVILHDSVYSGCSTWTERMTKYGDLVHCQYYVTSEANFNHYIPYNNTTDPNSGQLMSLKFYSLASNTIQVKLAASNDSTPIDTAKDSDSNPYPMESSTNDDDAYIETSISTTEKPFTYAKKGRIESHQHDVGYLIVIGAPETSIATDTNRIRTLSTPDILRADEPNEVLINIFNDGQLKIAVNGIEALHSRVEFADDLKFFSFASVEDHQRQEFFYSCV